MYRFPILYSFSLLFLFLIFFSSVLGKSLDLDSKQRINKQWINQWINTEEKIFFPSSLYQKFEKIRNFQIHWWNFLVLEEFTEDEKERLCSLLHKQPELNRAECGKNLERILPFAYSWAKDIFLRQAPPSEEVLLQKIQETLAQASFPLPRPILQLYRYDPLRSHEDLIAFFEKKQVLSLPLENGFFVKTDLKGRNVTFIPFQFSFSPKEEERTKLFFSLLQKEFPQRRWHILGSHASTLKNREQIEFDLEKISLFGTVNTLLFVILVIWIRRTRLLWGIPMIFVGAGIGALATILVFGSIHGIVLSFGMGIMGLLLDYTIHGAFNSQSAQVWKSNFVGLLTTLLVFFVLLFSTIPLLRELAFFSLFGLSGSYGFIYLCHIYFSPLLSVEPLPYQQNLNRFQIAIASSWLAGLFFLFFHFSIDLSLLPFDFQPQEIKKWQTQLFPQLSSKNSLFEVISPSNTTTELFTEWESRRNWANANQIQAESPAFYLPPPKEQRQNQIAWVEYSGEWLKKTQSLSSFLFLEPFWRELQHVGKRAIYDWQQPAKKGEMPLYLKDFESKGDWLHIWFPNNKKEEQKIMTQYPQSQSLRSLAEAIPQTLQKELQWMIPISFLLLFLVLWFYFRKFSFAGIALLPFFVGLGGLSIFHFFGMQLSFISLVGIIILLGLGVDYGIFAVDHGLNQTSQKTKASQAGLHSALLFASITTIMGYIPLLFCDHPVLFHLGMVLTIGTLGCVLGTFWLVPFFMPKLLQQKKCSLGERFFLILIIPLIFLSSCSTLDKKRTSQEASELFFPWGKYTHEIHFTMNEQEYSFRGVLQTQENFIHVIGLSPFQTTLFKIRDNLKTKEIETEVFHPKLEKRKKFLLIFYSLLKKIIESKRNDKNVEKKIELQDGAQGISFLITLPGTEKDSPCEVILNKFDENQVANQIQIQTTLFQIRIETIGYEI